MGDTIRNPQHIDIVYALSVLPALGVRNPLDHSLTAASDHVLQLYLIYYLQLLLLAVPLQSTPTKPSVILFGTHSHFEFSARCHINYFLPKCRNTFQSPPFSVISGHC